MPPLMRATERFEQATLPMATISLEGDLLRVNEALCRLVGRTPSELRGTPVTALAAGPTRSPAHVLHAVRGGAPGGEVAGTLRASDGSAREGRVAWTLQRDEQGRPSSLTAVWVDETEARTAQAALARSEARWRALLAETVDSTWTAEPDGTITSAPPGPLAGRLALEPDAVRGRNALDQVHPDDREAFRAAWQRLVRGASSREVVECRIRDAHGESTWVRQTVRDLRGDPDVRSLVGHVVDIGEQRRQEQERSHSEARLRATFEQSFLPQTVVAPDRTLSVVNQAFCDLVGRSREDLLGRHVREVAHPRDDGSAEAVLASVLSGASESAQVEQVLRGATGQPVHVLVSISLLRDPQGEPCGAAAFLQDLSTLRRAEQRRRQQEEFFLALSQRASDLALVGDQRGRILYASPALEHVLGYHPVEVVAADADTFLHPDDVGVATAAYRAAVTSGDAQAALVRVRAADGEWRSMEVTVSSLLDTPVGGVVANLRDVTERLQAERALRASELRYRAIADTAQEGIWATSPDGRTLYANARMAEVLGVPLAELYTRNALEFLDREQSQAMRRRLAERSTRGSERYELPYRHPDGGERVLSVSATPLPAPDGTIEGSLGMVSDITSARRNELELRHAALHDSLTGLPNRALLLDRLEHALARQASTAVVFVDLDQFKIVNDSRGHGAGDELLVAVARRLSSAVRGSDTVGRFGGDEFVVICEDVDEQGAIDVAEGLLQTLREDVVVDGAPVHVRASLGVAVSPAPSASDLLRYADTAMYTAKAAGRGCVRLFDPGLSQEVEQRWSLAADLRQALADDALELHYQPVVDVATGELRGVEALARWQHPEHGAVPPLKFVHLAELIGLGADLDRWVVRRALGEAAGLSAAGILPLGAYVAVNLSAGSLTDPELEPLLTQAAREAALAPGQVVLEITESAIMTDPDRAVPLLRRLRSLGFQVAVDDFGTGYSSLAYLRDLPVTSLKIDRSFVAGLTDGRDSRAIVASVLELARALDLLVVAEGVETEEQAAVLRELGCPTGQGWLWSRAVPAAELPAPAWLVGTVGTAG